MCEMRSENPIRDLLLRRAASRAPSAASPARGTGAILLIARAEALRRVADAAGLAAAHAHNLHEEALDVK